MTSTTFPSCYGEFTLQRRPLTPHLPLQAWDAADEYLLAECSARNRGEQSKILIINDQFGALATALNTNDVCSWSDSYTAHCATAENFARNRLDTSRLQLLPSSQMPAAPFDIVLWRVPKTWALFQQQARAVSDCIGENGIVLIAGMQKHLPPSLLDFLRQLGDVDVLPAKKKARAFTLSPQLNRTEIKASDEKTLRVNEYGLQLQAGPNVFSRDAFDIGSRFFLDQFAKLPRAHRVADLGCGNGLLGLRIKQLQPWAQIEFFDESYQAVAAAANNYANNGLEQSQPAAVFHVDDGLSHYDGEPFDLVVCNPPFHQGHVVGDHIAWQMFKQSRQHLAGNGELWIVGNRHLDYHIKLKKLFGNCRQIAANAKFVVLAATKA